MAASRVNRARLALVLALAALAAPAAAQADYATTDASAGCVPPGMNGQCGPMGSILMEVQKDVLGQPVEVTTKLLIKDTFKDRDARSFMFSVRNVSGPEGPSPVTVQLVSFTTPNGEVAITKSEQPSANELALWVDVLDVPVHEPIDLVVRVGANERGAYRLETLVMPFDRAYHPITADGGELSLFAFTFLAVNKQTADVGGPTSAVTGLDKSLARNLPGPEPLVALAAVGAAALLLAGPRGRRRTPLQMFRRP